MSPSPSSARRVIERLRESLDAVSTAVVDANLAQLLNAEAELSAAVASLGAIAHVPDEDRPSLLEELQRARLALSRCEYLGLAVDYMTDATLIAHGFHDAYTRAGQAAHSPSSSSSMDVRV